ncbi:hypothetical protein AXG93_1520s1020 [Marchantia polymorpha subsp. ruderalis]|uniref:Uncharacterized protein n=1 Tax=Marchantia polymorpha subsp. ruderalis TaxID=1480154 RepID=A0A176VG88_MARPO|nr:hypothetical protein AXG93_1520s1020 [Marchantia polymorpha subsp. ruderalis]
MAPEVKTSRVRSGVGSGPFARASPPALESRPRTAPLLPPFVGLKASAGATVLARPPPAALTGSELVAQTAPGARFPGLATRTGLGRLPEPGLGTFREALLWLAAFILLILFGLWRLAACGQPGLALTSGGSHRSALALTRKQEEVMPGTSGLRKFPL